MSRSQFQNQYQISPIILTDGIAGQGGTMPISDLFQDSGGSNQDEAFATFHPASDAVLIMNQLGKYPFANQTVAANAIIAQPRTVSMIMQCPARGEGGMMRKSAIIQAMQKSLQEHILSGGVFTVMTPAYQYDNCVLLTMRDISDGESKQPQFQWLLEFEQPLLTLAEAQAAQNTLMQKISAGTQTTGDPPDATPEG